jgi:hypothetical protein
MTALLWVFVGLLCLKLLWNVVVPFELASRPVGSGVSLMPYLEVALWFMAVAASVLASGTSWLHRPANVAVWGLVAIVGSYVALFVIGFLLGAARWMLRRNWR